MGVCGRGHIESAISDDGVLRHLPHVHAEAVLENVRQRGVEALHEAGAVDGFQKTPRRLRSEVTSGLVTEHYASRDDYRCGHEQPMNLHALSCVQQPYLHAVHCQHGRAIHDGAATVRLCDLPLPKQPLRVTTQLHLMSID